MSWLADPLACVLAPLVALPALAAIPRRRPQWATAAAAAGLGTQLLVLLLAAADSAWLAGGASVGGASPRPWLPTAGVALDLRLDGLNMVPAALVPLLGLAALAATPRPIAGRCRRPSAAVLVVASAAVGALCALDLVALSFALQVAALGAAYLLAHGTGAAGRRAAVRFAVYHLAAGAVPLAMALVMQAWVDGQATAAVASLARVALPLAVQTALLAAAVLCFAVPLGLAPVHGWMAPCFSAGGRAGVLLVAAVWPLLGAHGLCRIGLGLFAGAVAHWGAVGAGLAVLASLYAGLIATAQADLGQRLSWVFVALSGPLFLALCTGAVEGAAGALLVACAQAPVRLLLAALALDRGARGPAAASLWLAAGLCLVAIPGSGAFAGALPAATAVAAAWPVHGLLVLAAAGVASGALLLPYAELRGAAPGGLGPPLRRSLRLVAAVVLTATVVAGLHPRPLAEVMRPAVTAVLPTPAAGGSAEVP